jgi:hypothetical protein
LKHFLAEIATNPDKLAEFQRNPDELMHAAGLSAEDIAAVKGRNPAALEARLDGQNASPGAPVTWLIVPGSPQGGSPPMPGSIPGAGGMMPGGVMPGVCIMIYPTCQSAFPAQGLPSPVTYFPIPPNQPVTYAVPVTTGPGSSIPVTYFPITAPPIVTYAVPTGGQGASGSVPFAPHNSGIGVTYMVKLPEPFPAPGRPQNIVTYQQPVPQK